MMDVMGRKTSSQPKSKAGRIARMVPQDPCTLTNLTLSFSRNTSSSISLSTTHTAPSKRMSLSHKLGSPFCVRLRDEIAQNATGWDRTPFWALRNSSRGFASGLVESFQAVFNVEHHAKGPRRLADKIFPKCEWFSRHAEYNMIQRSGFTLTGVIFSAHRSLQPCSTTICSVGYENPHTRDLGFKRIWI